MTLLARTIVAFLALCAPGVAFSQLYPLDPAMWIEIVSGNNQIVRAGEVSAERLVIRILGFQNKPVAGVPVSFGASCFPQFPGYPCADATNQPVADQVTDAQGLARSSLYRASEIAGDVQILVSSPTAWSYHPEIFNMAVADANGRVPAAIQVVSGDGQEVRIGTAMAEPFVVRVVDATGQPVRSAALDLSLACWVSPAAQFGAVPCMNIPGGNANRHFLSDEQGRVRSPLMVANEVPGPIWAEASLGWTSRRSVLRALNVLPPKRATTASARGTGGLALRMERSSNGCMLERFESRIPDRAAPPMLALPHGLVRFVLSGCAAGESVALSFHHPGGVPEGARLWMAAPRWEPIPSTQPVTGTVQFTATDGGVGDADGARNGRIEGVIGLAFGDPDAPNFQDLWWAGSAESGWGLSIVQHDDMLFPTLFAYDAGGNPAWYALLDGSWSESRDVFSGSLYSPRGKPLGTHVASDLVVGPPMGSASLRFGDAMNAVLEIDIGGAVTRKAMTRQFFGPMDAGTAQRHGDMWWAGPSRNGWGLVLQQQYSTLFGVLFTYRDDGTPTWLAMPSGNWTSPESYEGRVFRTTSSPWPRAYDAARLDSDDVGAFRLRFSDGKAIFELNADGHTGRFELAPLPF